MSSSITLSLLPVDDEHGPEAGRALLAEAQQRMGMIPNMYRGMANAPALLATYRDGYARFREQSGFTPAEQEVVFLSISRENGCNYCVGAHSFLADHVSGVARAVTDAIRGDGEIPDARLSVLSRFTRHLVASRGWPQPLHARAFLDAGYTETQVLHLVLAIAVKTMSNYTNHLLATPLDAAFASRAVTPGQGPTPG